jgi:hypothetical protein
MLFTIFFCVVKVGVGSLSVRDRRNVGEIKESKKITPNVKADPIGIRYEASDSDSSCSGDGGTLALIEVPVDVV